MARIKIKDLRKGKKISREELKKLRGGALYIKFAGAVAELHDRAQRDWCDFLSPYSTPVE